MERTGKDNRFLYMLKGIACMMVVFIHFGLPGRAGQIVSTLARFAVPMFFVISGRYLYGSGTPDTPGMRARMIRKLGRLMLTAVGVLGVYTLYSLLIHLSEGMTPAQWVQMKYQPVELVRFLTLNASRVIWDPSYVFDFLWYLFAMVWVQVVMIITLHWRDDVKQALCVALMSMLYVCQYLGFSATVPVVRIFSGDTIIFRNWLFTGIPFTLAGVWIARGNVKKTRSPLTWSVIALAGALMALREARHFGGKELPLGIGLMVIALAVLAESSPNFGSRTLAYVGKYLSAKVYYWHVLVGNLLQRLFVRYWPEGREAWFFPLLVLCATLLISLLLHKCVPQRSKR